MSTIITTVGLVIVAVVAGLIWERATSRRQAGASGGETFNDRDPKTNASRRVVLAYSFQSDLGFSDAARLLGAKERQPQESRLAGLGEWYERDSAWYPELLSCRSHHGMWMNLYFFDKENILELKFMASDAAQTAAENFALNELLPALGARDVKPTESVD